MKKWLDKYNDGGKYLGTTNKGFDYNGAWGGTMQLGGSLPGAVGFMYTRTQGAAPSNGPYGKKTKASAQPGIAISDNTRIKPIVTEPVSKSKESGNWLNKLIADNVTAYGFFGSSDNFVAPNDKLAELSYQHDKFKNNLYKKYNYSRTSREKMPEKLRNELKEADTKINEELSKIAYNVKSKEKINIPNINPITPGERFENYTNTGNIFFPNIRPENINASQDALYIHQGLPQKHNSFIQSKYKPTKETNKGQSYYSFSPDVEKEIINDLFKYQNSDFIKSKDKFRQVTGSHVAQASLKDFQYSKGKDEKGDYVAYYDINDYDNILDYVPNSKPFEIYGRIYYDPKTGKPKMQNGGEMQYYQQGLDWTPKNISKKGSKIKKDDNGYWNPENWGEPVEIDSNEITMQGVYEPLIGISDTGDVQYMEPGEDYTFDGESVTEYPVAQSGKKQQALVDEQLEYIKSPLYVERLKKVGVKDPEKLASERADYLRNTQINVAKPGPLSGIGIDTSMTTSGYKEGKEYPIIQLAKDYTEGTLAHEIGHVTTGPEVMVRVSDKAKGQYNQLAPIESWKFYNLNKNLKPKLKEIYERYKQPKSDIIVPYYSSDIVAEKFAARDTSELAYKPDPHDVTAAEAYGDLSAIRHFLKKEGITKSYGESITPEMWEKAMKNKKLSNEEHFKRMLKNYDKDAIIYLNNVVAKNEGPTKETYAKNGGWLDKYN